MSRLIVLMVVMGIAFIEDLDAQQLERPCEQTLAGLHGDASALGIPDRGTWKAEVDNELDGVIREANTRLFVLESVNNALVGHYIDREVGGAENCSIFTGQAIPGATVLVTLRQDDRTDYTALYTGRCVSASRIVGSYVDNRGGAGDWSLTLVCEQEEQEVGQSHQVEPLSRDLPDEPLFESVMGVYGKAIRGERQPFINLRPPHRDLWNAEVQEIVQGALSYQEVEYIGKAKLVIPETTMYCVEIPGAGVEFRLNCHRFESGEVALAKGLYEVEIYTNHWGQPYLTYADVTILRKRDRTVIPFVNTASEIEAFRSQQIAGRSVLEVSDYTPRPVE